ncbi:hypothetical protein [Synechococcus sp. RedBA-s]|uniref:hypothetical protein n=1 Tax=Synechococcus sp. RedBA-s TaxID=2823741 RepID=UPI0020CFCD8E|nr:hypothetical protein [Synechococcus sp. RedBA-s]MCP9801598.1 hypothetical protein [Synechococcus sp. RedBA-s]
MAKTSLLSFSCQVGVVIKPEFYPFAFCFDQSIERKGGNQSGGSFRSGVGRRWQHLGARP